MSTKYTVVGVNASEQPMQPRVMHVEADDADHANEQFMDMLISEGSTDVVTVEIYKGHLVGELLDGE